MKGLELKISNLKPDWKKSDIFKHFTEADSVKFVNDTESIVSFSNPDKAQKWFDSSTNAKINGRKIVVTYDNQSEESDIEHNSVNSGGSIGDINEGKTYFVDRKRRRNLEKMHLNSDSGPRKSFSAISSSNLNPASRYRRIEIEQPHEKSFPSCPRPHQRLRRPESATQFHQNHQVKPPSPLADQRLSGVKMRNIVSPAQLYLEYHDLACHYSRTVLPPSMPQSMRMSHFCPVLDFWVSQMGLDFKKLQAVISGLSSPEEQAEWAREMQVLLKSSVNNEQHYRDLDLALYIKATINFMSNISKGTEK